MEITRDNWPVAAARWVLEGQPSSLPAAIAEAATTAPAHELQFLVDVLLDQCDQLTPSVANGLDLNDAAGSELGHAPSGHRQSEKAASERTGLVARLRSLLQLTAARILRLRLEGEEPDGSSTSEIAPALEPETVAELALELAEVSPLAAAHCLQILSAQGDMRSLAALGELLTRPLLEEEQAVAVALSPLFQWPPKGLAQLYEHLAESIWHWQLLAPMLDLAGHALRKGKLVAHPLAGQAQRLRQLLESSVNRLTRLEADPKRFGEDVASIQRVLNHALALTVSLCDALGLIGDRQAEPALKEAMSLSHRRVQTEAAGALARLGNPEGRSRLLSLAADPASRLRAVAYADELNIEDPQLIDWREPSSIAEAEVISWLSAPDRFGVPPAQLELIDERTLYWPSYEQPQNCFLFRFTYHFAQGDLSNLIMAGPLVYAFQADLRSLELDDVVALFAGWQAEHEDIFEVPMSSANLAQRTEVDRLLQLLSRQGIEQLNPLALTFFFGERAVLALGQRAGQQLCTVSDGLETIAFPISQRPTSLTPDLVLAIYRGRKLLRSFN